jgi:DNA-binding transcriptional ArsR family regulator
MLISVKLDALRVFADPLRCEIIRLLAAEQLCTCHLVAETGAVQPTVSHHLRVLREAGLVEGEPSGRFTYYRLRPDAVAAMATDLAGLADAARAVAGTRRPC